MSVYGSIGASSMTTMSTYREAHPLAPPTSPTKRNDKNDDGPPLPDSDPRQSLRIPASYSSSPDLPRLPQPQARQLLRPTGEARLAKQLPTLNRIPAAATAGQQQASAPAPTHPTKPGGNRILMAGYLAHEFLSRGTLFGRPYGTSANARAARKEEPQQKRKLRYEEVAGVLWEGGAHVPGLVNPTQLHRWLQMQEQEQM